MKRLENIILAPCAAMIATPWFNDPITETEILILQDKFLTNGFQSIQVKDITAGRALIQTFLASFTMYCNVACVSLEQESLHTDMFNIYYELETSKNVDLTLEQFLIDQFYFDFIWIEETPSLLSKSWYQEFKNLIIGHKLDQHLPIIILSYQ